MSASGRGWTYALVAALGLALAASGKADTATAATGGGPATTGAGSNVPPRSVDIHRLEDPPRIDGSLEPIWQQGDSTSGFVQNQPFEKTPPTEQTTVYLLQDDDNLYVAFRCYARRHPPTANYTKDEDYVTVSFDPFGSRTTGYYFTVYGSGMFVEGLTEDDGRVQDASWEGVWYHADRVYSDRLEVEMKIPFKTVRFREGLA